jgi:uncharacterized protein
VTTDRILNIKPSEIAFDIDGVVADTMDVFLRLAKERYGLSYLTRDHLACYDLHRCLNLDKQIVDELICLTLDDEHTRQVPPMAGAPTVLSQLAQHGPLRFVTARIWPESIIEWLYEVLPQVPRDHIQVIATGAPEAKLGILKDLAVEYFVEDRLETCELLARDGLSPILFDQPWNRTQGDIPFPRILNWSQLHRWILPDNGDLM